MPVKDTGFLYFSAMFALCNIGFGAVKIPKTIYINMKYLYIYNALALQKYAFA